MGSFAKKLLRITLTLTNNAVFDGTNSNVLVLSNLRAVARLKLAGFPAFPEADVEIYGMRQADMNALTALSRVFLGYNRNTILIEANGGEGWAQVFSGEIVTAQPDYADMPDVVLRITARTLFFASLNPTAPTSYTGPTDVATIVQNLATQMGFSFENNGVTTQLNSPYLTNTAAEQLRTVCAQAGIDCYIEGKTIAITPRGQPRKLPVWVLSPETGLVRVPLRTSQGYITCRVLFNPAFHFGSVVNLKETGAPNAPTAAPAYSIYGGNWLIATVNHTLESQKFGGSWFSDLLCYPPGQTVPFS